MNIPCAFSAARRRYSAAGANGRKPADEKKMRTKHILIRLIRTNLGSVLKKDYIRALRAKGISPGRIIMKHGMKNSFMPVLTRSIGMIINMLCGSAVIESIFSINGIGKIALEAVVSKDTPVLQCFILVLSAVVVVVNLLVDILYSVVDRRIQL